MKKLGAFGADAPLLPRRHFLWQSGSGLGAIALAWLLDQEAGALSAKFTDSPYAPKPTHFAAKAKRVIHIFAIGGVSHVDTFDYKADLIKHDGKAMTTKGKIDTFFGKPGNLMKSPWEFSRRGVSGLWVSDLLPHLATCVDDMTFIYSMVANTSNHAPATFQMNTGFIRNGFPCLGSWLAYGLGSENQDLPAFVVLPDPRGVPGGGSINWTSGFLPATNQGTAFRTSDEQPIADLATPKDVPAPPREASMALLRKMNQDHLETHPEDTTLADRIRSYELAARMQVSIPEIIDFSGESEETKRLYDLDSPVAGFFGRNCLLARRLLERGVRFVQVYHGGLIDNNANWDAHADIYENHPKQAESMDKPLAGLLKDLKARGMLEDTLVVWTTEFGRMPITQGVGERGRDHNQHAFTCWLAGAGLKPGFGYGSSDEVGYRVGENPVTIYDFHATILHLLGLDHKRLTYYHNGIHRRLTDVHGHVIQDVLKS